MRYFLICDNADTHTGMRMAGVEGVIVHERQETIDAIRQTAADETIAVLLITEKLAALCPELVDELKLSVSRPLVTVIPDRHGTERSRDFITRYIQEAIGIRL